MPRGTVHGGAWVAMGERPNVAAGAARGARETCFLASPSSFPIKFLERLSRPSVASAKKDGAVIAGNALPLPVIIKSGTPP